MQYQEALKTLAALGPELRTGNTALLGKADAATAPSTGTAAPTAARKFTLDHIRTLLAHLGDPQQRFPSVLIAGTNGKGSTAATLASVCRAAGLRTGLYTSPHLLRVNERIRVDGVEIPDADFGRLFGLVYITAGQLVGRDALPHTPSFFELLTAVAFCWFAEQGIDLAVLEVGLGGRLDATNVVHPILSVIADIGIDHTEFLGNSIREIATEKAGILRENGVLVTLSQHPEANAAIGERALALNVRGVDAARFLPPRGFSGVPEAKEPINSREHTPAASSHTAPPSANRNELEGPVPTSPVTAELSSSSFDPAERAHRGTELPPTPERSPLGRNRYSISIDGQLLHLDSPLAGHHQQRNLALAVATALELRAHHGFLIPNAAIEAGVRSTEWPGRLEWLPSTNPAHAPILLDVAHNPAGAWTLRAALSQLPDERPRTLIFSCLADKQIDEMARILLPLFDPTSGDPARTRDHIVLAPIANPRAATVEQLLTAAHALDIPAHAAPHLSGALQQARALTPANGVIVVTGSVYLIGELRALVLTPDQPSPPAPAH